jgi:CRISPR-associated protein (TIGR02584 family)
MYRDRVVLIGVVGMSPAVLTETVWALAQEHPPLIVDEVVAITTSAGRDQIQNELFDSSVWSELQRALGAPDKLRFGASASIQVIGDGQRDFDDIVTPEENAAAADFLLQQLRRYSEDANTRIIASIAGGRKTMSALMLACMSLLGREQDRVCHVLANDNYLFANKGFCFPRSAAEAASAQIRLSDIPFIRVRGWYQQESGKAPASYSHMVSLFRQTAPTAVVEEKVTFASSSKQLFIGEVEIDLSPAEFDATAAFVRDRKSGKQSTIQELLGPRGGTDADDAYRKYLSRVRTKIKKAGFAEVAGRLLPGAKERNYLYRNISFTQRRPRTSEK